MSDPNSPAGDRKRVPFLIVGMVVFALAVLMGFPALRGTFVGGDDHRLVLNHVLVNQPSWRHAVELFTIVHRDLYQPIPLLTFQLEFVTADAFNLFADGVERGAWLFHFDNMWLHGVNTLLVAAVLLMLQHPTASAAAPLKRFHIRKRNNGHAAAYPDPIPRSSEALTYPAEEPLYDPARAIAWAAALLFAVHPLNVEVVAWINGRMMLLSTLFALGAMLAFARWLDRGRVLAALLTLLFVVLSGVSKVRVGLPILLALVPLARGHKLDRRFWPLWLVCTAVVGGLAALNVWTTAEADFFSGGAEHLQGPRAVRVLMALAFYFEHFVWPVGLSSYYPAPPLVAWAEPATIRAAITVLVACGILGWASGKSRACLLATVWFFAGLFDTLPFFPARNVLAADRYMYLPIIGLLWFTATVGQAGHRCLRRRSPTASHAALTVGVLALIPLLVGICWRVAAGYATSQAQAQRIAELFPQEPRVWERLGWTHHRAGDYEVAIELARRELRHPEPDVRSGAYQLIGLSEVKRGNAEAGLRFLHEAAVIDTDSGLAYFRLAQGYEDLGQYAGALPHYEKAVELAPADNPTIRRLARVYRRLDLIDQARAAYGKALANNRFDVEAALGLAELAIESGEETALLEAERLLSELLVDVPSEPRVRTDLGLLNFLRREGDETLKLAAAAFIALTDGRYATAAERVGRLCAAGADPAEEWPAAAAEARGWLLTQLERFDQQRPGEAWTFGLSARLLIANSQPDAARAALALFESLCAQPQCAAYAADLRWELIGS